MSKYADNDDLNVVIVQQQQLCNNNSSGAHFTLVSDVHRSSSGASCRRHQRSKTAARQCNNATQTPNATLQSADWHQHRHQCLSKPAVCCHCSHGCENCCTTAAVEAAHNTSCFHSVHRRSTHDHCIGDVNSKAISIAVADITCHCHFTHLCHQHYSQQRSAAGANGAHSSLDRRRHPKRRREPCTRRKLYRQPHQQLPLPAATTKSSLSSDDQLGDCQHRQRRPLRSPRLKNSQTQEIAIEIDAASSTLTDDNHSACNSSTATSNFSYKLANDNYASQQPVAHDKALCRSSMVSNTTVETSELTDHSDNGAAELQRMPADRRYVGESPAADDDSSTPPPVVCCEDPQCCRVVAASSLQNSSVKIKRKRFISQRYCSSCSKCSSCSCQMHTSSCSSFEDFEAELDLSRKAHEFTVAADCHRCQLQRQSTNSTAEGADDECEAGQRSSATARSVKQRGGESALSSRRSSRETFCSCNSTSCCYCSCSCEEGDASNAKALAASGDVEQHSSTLTPITQPSTPLAEDPPTLRSNSTGLGDDSASLSQSAEYFSLSSNHQLAVAVLPANATPRKQCKHYSKHHRHKRDLSPLDKSL